MNVAMPPFFGKFYFAVSRAITWLYIPRALYRSPRGKKSLCERDRIACVAIFILCGALRPPMGPQRNHKRTTLQYHTHELIGLLSQRNHK